MLYPKPQRQKSHKPKRSAQTQQDVIHRDGQCMWCGIINDTLVGHHISSWGASGDDSLENVITLCGSCHNNVGQGYLDSRKCNNPWVLSDRGLVAAAHSRTEPTWKLWDPNKYLRRILDAVLQS